MTSPLSCHRLMLQRLCTVLVSWPTLAFQQDCSHRAGNREGGREGGRGEREHEEGQENTGTAITTD